MIEDPHKEILIKIQDKKIPVWFYGNRKNQPILFIHGRFRGFSQYIGDLPPRYLSKKYYICAFDLPGFGKSREINMSSSEFISVVVDQFFKDRKVVVFGASYGGIVALTYYRNCPKNVRSLIIAATPVFTGILKAIYLSGFLPKLKSRVSFVQEFKIISKKEMAKVKVPTLLIYSTKDFLAPAFMGKTLHKMIPNSKLIIITTRIHRMFLHRIDETGILRAIEDFI